MPPTPTWNTEITIHFKGGCFPLISLAHTGCLPFLCFWESLCLTLRHCINRVSSFCKSDVLTSALHAFAECSWFWTTWSFTWITLPWPLSCLSHCPPDPLGGILLPKVCSSNTNQSIQSPHTNHFWYWALTGPLSTCPNHPRARYRQLETSAVFQSPLNCSSKPTIYLLNLPGLFLPEEMIIKFLVQVLPSPSPVMDLGASTPPPIPWFSLVMGSVTTCLSIGHVSVAFTVSFHWNLLSLLYIKISMNTLYFKIAM